MPQCAHWGGRGTRAIMMDGYECIDLFSCRFCRHSSPVSPLGCHPPPPGGGFSFDKILSIFFQKPIYFLLPMVYDMAEQSRGPRVKCRQNGELSGGRRQICRDEDLAPAAHKRIFSFMRAILGRAIGRLKRCFRKYDSPHFCGDFLFPESLAAIAPIKEAFL